MENFSGEQLKGIEMLFRQFDADNSGKIDLMEFKMLAVKMGIEMSEERLLASMRGIVGDNQDPELDLQEFIEWLRQCQTDGNDPFSVLKAKIKAQGIRPLTNDQIEALQECFNTFDTDGSGSIDVQELGEVFASFGHEYTDEEIQAMINEVDADQSGEIEFEEFLLLMMSNFGHEESSGEEVQLALRRRDTKKTGCVSRADFEMVMRDLCGDSLTDKEIKEISAIAAEVASPHGRGKPTHDGLIEYMKWDSLWEAVQDQM
eukprot:TRINITY_DN15788_c0_g1_i1.p1 TRINITY_DN15788_c0_g1~~TRINITY_DN15788_c0_g1_i1.p1  ORF type:complete len:260 (+),score=138.18 TRINITY_DN15788_c0_g1_i1:281-1060(+)